MTHSWKISLFFMTILLLSFQSIPGPGQDDINKQIVAALTSGDVDALSEYFNSNIDLGISGNDDSYSKAQATQILKDFFTKNPVKSMKITKQGSSTDGSQFYIGEMKAGTDTFRVYYLLKKVEGRFFMKQLQIQKRNG